MEMHINNGISMKYHLLVELVGLAGTGKTTLSQALSQRNENILIGHDLQLRKIEQIPIFISHVPFMLPVVLRRSRLSRWLTWNEIKAIVYLYGGKHIFKQQTTRKGTIIILDQGPIFKLATLNAFGPESLKTQGFETWWHSMYKRWASSLDMVIWLDAPDTVLMERIYNREKRHIIKNSTERELFKFLADYRVSYEYIIDNMRFNGEPKLLQFNTNQVSVEQIVKEVLVSFNLKLDGNRNISVH
jgi:shikimate kinase